MVDEKQNAAAANPQRPTSPDYRKPCTLCDTPRDVLVRCQIDETGRWHFVCPGSCWKQVSGGKIDGDGDESHQWYRYGGMWKNKHEAVSAKKPKRKNTKPRSAATGKESQTLPASDGTEAANANEWNGDGTRYTRNDKVRYNDGTWICRKSHYSEEKKTPARAYQLWKEAKGLVEDPD